MIVYGRNPVREALRGRRAGQVSEVWVAHGAAREPWLAEANASTCARVHMSPPAEIERRCGSAAHQGVCAEAGGYPYVSAGELLSTRPRPDSAHPLIVALDEVQDPQNLGSICRTAECVGASGVVICERRAAEITPAACKASAGAVEHLRVARVRNLADFLGQAREAGCWCYGASAAEIPVAGAAGGRRGGRRGGRGGRAPVRYDAPDYTGAGVVLVLGGEGRGLRPRVAGACDELIALPLHGRVDSLNVSAVAAVMMYEILQRRGA